MNPHERALQEVLEKYREALLVWPQEDHPVAGIYKCTVTLCAIIIGGLQDTTEATIGRRVPLAVVFGDIQKNIEQTDSFISQNKGPN